MDGADYLLCLPSLSLAKEIQHYPAMSWSLNYIKSSSGRTIWQGCLQPPFKLVRDYVTLNILFFCPFSPSGLWRLLPVKGEQHCVCIPWAQFTAISENVWKYCMYTEINCCLCVVNHPAAQLPQKLNTAPCLRGARSVDQGSARCLWNIWFMTHWCFMHINCFFDRKKRSQYIWI